MTNIDIPDLKSLREALCVSMSAIGQTYVPNQTAYAMSYIGILQELTDKIDILRPLGPDGKHGNRHTEFCGCDLIWRDLPGYSGYEVSSVGNLRETGEEVWYNPFIVTPDNLKWFELYPNRKRIILSDRDLIRMAFPEFEI